MNGHSGSEAGKLDEAPDMDTSQSFWEVGNYRKVVRRIDDGAKLTSDLAKMIQERAEVESRYIRHLHHWSKKWEELVHRGPEYGTTEAGWKAVVVEAVRVAEVHEGRRKKLEDVAKNVLEWKSQQYHKTIAGRLRESKRAEESFGKAQKIWAKDLDHNNKAKKAFHNASRELETTNAALAAAETNTTVANIQEQIYKLKERRDKVEKEVDKTRQKYQDRLCELFHQKNHYVEDMEREFERSQAFEKQRLLFFRDILVCIKQALDITVDDRYVRCVFVNGLFTECES